MVKKIELIMEQAYTPAASKVQIIEEGYDASGAPKMVFKAVLQTANDRNQNGRVYPPEVLQQVVEALAPKAQARNLFSELDHPLPETADPAVLKKRAVAVLLKEACAMITDLQFDGQQVTGTFEVLDTPNGRILRALVKDGAQIGFSLRALGSVDPQPDGTLLVTGLKPITYDVVSTPSHSKAIVTEVITESSELASALKELSVIEEMETDSRAADVIMEGSANEGSDTICAGGFCMRGTYNEFAEFIMEHALANEKLKKLILKI